MNVLVTGATGAVGSKLVPLLLKRNDIDKVLTINRDINKACNLFEDNKILNIPINSDMKKEIILFQPDVVIHLAAYITSKDTLNEAEKLIDANIKFGVKLLDALRDTHVKYFVNFGTFAEYRFGMEEVSNAYFYSSTKTAFRVILDYYSEIVGFKYYHLVPYTIYGECNEQKKVINYIIDSLESDIPIEITNGEQILDFIHIDDILDYIINFISKLNILNNYHKAIFCVGTGQGTSLKELAEIIQNIYKQKTNLSWGAKSYRPLDVMYAVAPIQKNIEILHWKSKIDLISGIKRYKDLIGDSDIRREHEKVEN